MTNNFDAHQIDWLPSLWDDSCDSIELMRFQQHMLNNTHCVQVAI